MRTVTTEYLEIAYETVGPENSPPAILLHGFPYDARAYDEAARHLSSAGMCCIVPYLRGYGPTRFLSDQTPRSGQQAALGADLKDLLDALRIERAVLAGYDWGGRAACVAAALWPDRVAGLVTCGSAYNIQNIGQGGHPQPPEAEYRLWYQHYFQTPRGEAGLSANRHALCRLLWRQWSPHWRFTDAAYTNTAASFDNPDFVPVVIHSYRHRMGAAPGDPAYEAVEADLAKQPPISVPTICLHGGDDGVDPPHPDDLAATHFAGPYTRKILPGIGHNLPQEAPEAFAEAVLAAAAHHGKNLGE